MDKTTNRLPAIEAYAVPCVDPFAQTPPLPAYPFARIPAAPVTVTVPGSKSMTSRALLLATLADGASTLRGALFSEDSRHFLRCIQELGFSAVAREEEKTVRVVGQGGSIPLPSASLYVGSAGTAARFLTALLGLAHGRYHMDSSEQMRRRPMAPLLQALQELGCTVSFEGKKWHFPFILQSSGFSADHISVNIEHSSQFLSALLIAAALSGKDFTIRTEGVHGMSYIRMTQTMMEQFGVRVAQPAPDLFFLRSGQRYRALDYQIEPDVSAACYFYAMSPLLGIPVQVRHVDFRSGQGDIQFLRILEQLGCTLDDSPGGITVFPPAAGTFPGVEVDMSACSDQAITLAAIAPFAASPTVIRGIGHIRFQESDRIAAIAAELGKMGIRCQETAHSITIFPGRPKPALVHTYDDHRMAMGFSLTGLRAPGIRISHPECCRKTFENYFEILSAMFPSGTLCPHPPSAPGQ
ncbi:MAG: 3-phosphoshikimate 1-carboxyvinyltransferase [Clostridium sp.]|nr:3-phosphoshikimate 1-carboxyvinyltransferase [Clostridium sp.]